jgi:hypothetical protein
MKLFHFYRREDQSGVSGTGPVVEGVQFTNGWCALRWLSNMSSICFYQSIEEVKKIHSHGGKTEVIIHDFEPLSKPRYTRVNLRFELLMQIIEEASHLTVLADDPVELESRIHASTWRLKTLVNDLEKLISEDLKQSA